MRKIDRFSYNFFNFKLYTLEMDKSFFKYEETEKEQNTQIENFYIPNSLTRLKEIVNLFKFISKDDKSLVLAPGEQAVLTDEGVLSCETVDVTLYTAWKDGNFVFRKQRLEEVLNTLARWYDVDVFYEDVSRKDIEFTGNIQRFERFEEIVGLLQMAGDTEFEVKGKSIFVRRK